VARSVQDYVWLQYYIIVVLDTAVSGEAILIRRESGTKLALDNCAIPNGLFVNDVRVKEIAKCFRVCDQVTFRRRLGGDVDVVGGEVDDVGERVDIQGCQGY
jgi:hypothetical protein